TQGQSNSVLGFSDLSGLYRTNWEYPVIKEITEAGLMTGETINGEKVFNMNGKMNRAQVAVLVARYMGYTEDQVIKTEPFEDVGTMEWYSSAVSYLKEKDIIHGKTPETFAPTDKATRAEFYKMMIKAYIYMHPEVKKEWMELMGTKIDYFVDVKEENWFSQYIYLAAHKKLLKGYDLYGTKYALPAQDITRIEGATIVTNF
ncbi:MAG: S-layer homology domain-containing protein, partial [Candidatus Gracilibacteria bacterium]